MGDFTIGAVLRQTIDLLRRNAAALLLLALMVVGLPKALATYVVFQSTPRTAWAALPFGITFLGGILLQVAVIQTAVGAALDRAPGLGASLGLAVRQFLPILAINLLLTLGVSLAVLLLVFPALMLMCRWIAVIPAAVVERSGVFEPFRRSAELTQGSRWRIAGLLLIFLLLYAVGGFTVQVFAHLLARPAQIGWMAALLDGLGSALLGVFSGVGTAAIYLELRLAKEGLLSQDLIAVFD